MRKRRRSLVVAALLVALAACSSGKSTSQPTTTATAPKPTYTPVFAKGACTDEVPSSPRIECGALTVPEDRSKPDGRKVVLPVAIVHPADPSPAPDPVIYLSGGPGNPGLTAAASFLTNGQAGNHDVILLDQRGTGQSQPSLDCPEVHEAVAKVLETADSFDVESKIVRDALFVCRDRVRATGADLNQYNTTVVASDVADLRTALQIPQWNLFGVSYGTMVALVTMRDHPAGIRSVVLDSVLPPDMGSTPTDLANSVERVKGVFFAGCASDVRCHAAYPTLEADFASVVDGLNAAPYRGSIENPTLKRTTPITITGADAVSGFFSALYDESIIPQLPNVISQLKKGSAGGLIEQFVVEGIKQSDRAAEVQSAAVTCYDRAPFIHDDDATRILAQHPNDSTLLTGTAISCQDFGVAPAPTGFNDPVRSDIPTLVLADQYDPITPPEQSKHAADSLSRSTFVSFPGLGHGAVFAVPECPEIIFRAFLVAPTAPVDTSCVASMGPPNWNVG